jgi:hypothetical protein
MTAYVCKAVIQALQSRLAATDPKPPLDRFLVPTRILTVVKANLENLTMSKQVSLAFLSVLLGACAEAPDYSRVSLSFKGIKMTVMWSRR